MTNCARGSRGTLRDGVDEAALRTKHDRRALADKIAPTRSRRKRIRNSGKKLIVDVWSQLRVLNDAITVEPASS